MKNTLLFTIIVLFSFSCGPTPEEINDEWFNYNNNTDSAIMDKLSEIMKKKENYPVKEFCTNEDQLNQESRTGYKADGSPGTNFIPQYWSKIRFEPYGTGTLFKGVKQTPWHSKVYSKKFNIRWYLSLPPSDLSIGGNWTHYNFDGIYILYNSELEKYTQEESINLIVNDFTKDEDLEFLGLVDSIRNEFMSKGSYVINNNGNFEQNKKAWKDGQKNGSWKKWYNFSSNQKDERLLAETFYKNGQKNGKSIIYYENGKKQYESIYKDGELDGLWTHYYDNGQRRFEGTYKDGEYDGLHTTWFENGQKKWEETYKDGKLNGDYTKWYENGQKSSERIYKDGKLDGLSTSWYENGQKKNEGTFKDGKIVELIGKWNRDGSVKE